MSLKTALCLSKTAQTWREKTANSSDMTCFSGKSLRLGEKIRLHESAHETNFGFKSHVTKGPPEKCKESVFWIQILCRNQANPQILWCYQAKVTESLQKSGALSPSLTDRLFFSKRRTSRHVQWSSRRAPRSTKPPSHLQFLNNIQIKIFLTCNQCDITMMPT